MPVAQAFVNGCFPLGLAWKVCEKGGVCQGPCPPSLCDGAWGGVCTAVGVRAVKDQGCSGGGWMDGAAGLCGPQLPATVRAVSTGPRGDPSLRAVPGAGL